MNFIAYVQRQKNLIRRRHDGETFLIEKGEAVPVCEREKILAELDNLKGLNKAERLSRRITRAVTA